MMTNHFPGSNSTVIRVPDNCCLWRSERLGSYSHIQNTEASTQQQELWVASTSWVDCKGSLTLFVYIPCQNTVPHPTSRLASPLSHPQRRLMTAIDQSNPTQQVWPPILHDEETELGKQARRKAEAASKRISDKIDKEIEQERLKRAREGGPKILLLGASPLPYSCPPG